MAALDDLPGDPEALYRYLTEHDRGDGLPVRVPTDERVTACLDRTDRGPADGLIRIPTTFEELTVRTLAGCAVMAGCRPRSFPVVVAAFEAMAEWENLGSVMGTTEGTAVAAIVNGPATDELEINCGQGVFGPGYRANATIGRAIGLAFVFVGGVYPGSGTMATQSHQGRYTFCFGENEAVTDWEPLHADIGGLDPAESAVTVVTAHAPLQLSEGNVDAPTAEDVLEALAAAGDAAHATRGHPGELLFALSADHAGRLAESHSKRAVKEYLHEHCRRPDGERLLPTPEHALLVRAGGVGNYSSAIFAMNAAECHAVTRPVSLG